MLSREAHCRVTNRFVKIIFPLQVLNKRYVITRDERNIRLKRVPEEWLLPWEKLGWILKIFRSGTELF